MNTAMLCIIKYDRKCINRVDLLLRYEIQFETKSNRISALDRVAEIRGTITSSGTLYRLDLSNFPISSSLM